MDREVFLVLFLVVCVCVCSGVPQAGLGPGGSNPLVQLQASMFRDNIRNDYGQGIFFGLVLV